mmetsp:Transcript_32005/g.35852  ORF Transcript_32005/g.35852 Transcript_32005/m.35852 type:complete len:386 (+) Transcript_32005:41-1198(+)
MMMKIVNGHMFLQILCLVVVRLPRSFSLSSSSEVAQLTRARLTNALSSPSGKLTLSPEMFIPEPSNPTAILLQASAITQLSERIRGRAKANAAFLSADSLPSLRTFCDEQEGAQGNFPGPVPVIYCQSNTTTSFEESDDLELSDLALAGISGILVSINEGSEISSIDTEIVGGEDSQWLELYKNALEYGLQPVPEITVKDSTAATWKEEEMESLVKKFADLTGADPVSILLTINPTINESSDEDETEQKKEELPLPVVSRSLGRRVPIMASIRSAAGGNRIGEETSRLKASGFTGAVLRRECAPGFPANPNLEYLADFWSACIGNLKSTRSKTFNFRSKNNMEKNLSTQWANYQSDVISSGALGDDPDAPSSPGFDEDSGDYQGF